MIDLANFFSIHIDRLRSRLGMWKVGMGNQTKFRRAIIDIRMSFET